MSAELEFDAIADGQRLKLDGVWVSEGPDRFRLELRAPTGGVVFSVATNGRKLLVTMRGQLFSFKAKRPLEVLIYCYRWHP